MGRVVFASSVSGSYKMKESYWLEIQRVTQLNIGGDSANVKTSSRLPSRGLICHHSLRTSIFFGEDARSVACSTSAAACLHCRH